MDVIGRDAWGAKKPRWTTRLTRPVPDVFIHHGGTILDRDSEAGEAYQGYHLRKGWADVAYSFAVGVASGRVYELRGWENRPGATKGENATSYAVCIIGDTSKQQVSQACIDSVRALLTEGVEWGFIRSSFRLLGHRDSKATSCPGDSAYAALSEMRPKAPVSPLVRVVAPKLGKYLRVRRPAMRGPVVAFVQDKVGVTVDGSYGQVTAWYVGLWQLQHGLTLDGVVGPATYKSLSA